MALVPKLNAAGKKRLFQFADAMIDHDAVQYFHEMIVHADHLPTQSSIRRALIEYGIDENEVWYHLPDEDKDGMLFCIGVVMFQRLHERGIHKELHHSGN